MTLSIARIAEIRADVAWAIENDMPPLVSSADIAALCDMALASRAEAERLREAIEAFRPLGQVAFLWQTKGAQGDEVERYRDAYRNLINASSIRNLATGAK